MEFQEKKSHILQYEIVGEKTKIIGCWISGEEGVCAGLNQSVVIVSIMKYVL